MHATNNSCFFLLPLLFDAASRIQFFIVLLHIRLILDTHKHVAYIHTWNNYVQGRMRERKAFRDPRARFYVLLDEKGLIVEFCDTWKF